MPATSAGISLGEVSTDRCGHAGDIMPVALVAACGLAAKVTSPRRVTIKTVAPVSPIGMITIIISPIRAIPPIIGAITIESVSMGAPVRTVAIIIWSPIIWAVAIEAVGEGAPIRPISIVRPPIVRTIAVRGIRSPINRRIRLEMRRCEAKPDGRATYAAS
jgi:hypothetical protein